MTALLATREVLVHTSSLKLSPCFEMSEQSNEKDGCVYVLMVSVSMLPLFSACFQFDFVTCVDTAVLFCFALFCFVLFCFCFSLVFFWLVLNFALVLFVCFDYCLFFVRGWVLYIYIYIYIYVVYKLRFCISYNLYDPKIQVKRCTIVTCISYNLYNIQPKKWYNFCEIVYSYFNLTSNVLQQNSKYYLHTQS